MKTLNGYLKVGLTLAMFATTASAANALVLDFTAGTGDPSGVTRSFVESGFTISGCYGSQCSGVFPLNQTGIYGNQLTITNSTNFNASLIIAGLASQLRYQWIDTAFNEGFIDNIPYNIAGVTGYNSSVLVASTSFGFGSGALALDSTFSNLDELRITVLGPALPNLTGLSPAGFPYIPGTGQYLCDEGCGRVYVDSVTVSPVPLPPALVLLATPIALLGRMARKRK